MRICHGVPLQRESLSTELGLDVCAGYTQWLLHPPFSAPVSSLRIAEASTVQASLTSYREYFRIVNQHLRKFGHHWKNVSSTLTSLSADLLTRSVLRAMQVTNAPLRVFLVATVLLQLVSATIIPLLKPGKGEDDSEFGGDPQPKLEWLQPPRRCSYIILLRRDLFWVLNFGRPQRLQSLNPA
ncbi:hypothetical protein C8J57DRAFT_1240984 [Mycena rebaudengoi]|nr:hypothetical protein C8J57DRAFT_1240984 [Mycena rebaudengoi]